MLPHFIGIGAQKSGTTWLYINVKQHPQIWLPPVKELNYFGKNSSKHFLPNVLNHLLIGNREDRLRSYKFINLICTSLKKRQNILWFYRYLLLPRSDKWYASLFTPKERQITGEISPFYSIVNKEIVAKIYGLMPKLKIIYLIRNPIERTWSQANRTLLQRVHKRQHAKDKNIQLIMDKKETHQRSNYFETLYNWESFYPKHQIFIGFFEQLCQQPRQLLLDIYKFLGIDTSDKYISDSINQKRNKSSYNAIPKHWASYLAQQY